MKKFDIKKLLILVLAFVLVFALVACNNDSNDGDKDDSGKTPTPTPTPTPDDDDPIEDNDDILYAEDFFEKLWNGASVIGQEEIGKNDDIGIDLGLSLGVTNKGDELITLGIDANLVLDRDDNKNSAVKVKIHDLTGDDDNNWLTLYLFLDNPYVGYVDWSYGDTKASFQVGFDVGFNNTWAAAITEFLGNPVVAGKSVSEIITLFTKDMGDDWGLDGFISSLTSTFGLQDTINYVVDLITGMLGIDADADDGFLPLLKVLGPTLCKEDEDQDYFPCSIEDGLYTMPINFNLNGILGGLFSDNAKEPANAGDPESISYIGTMLSGLFGTDTNNLRLTNLKLQYGLDKDENLDGFYINAGLTLNKSGTQALDLKIGIDRLRFHNVTGQTAEQALGFAGEGAYAENFEFDVKLGAKLENDVLVMGDFNYNGAYEVEIKGMIDLLHATGNKTAIEATAKYNNAEIVKAVYTSQNVGNWGQIIVTVDNSVKFEDGEGGSIVGALGKYVMPIAVKALAGAKLESGEANVALNDAGLVLANALYTENFADATAVVAEDATFTYDGNFKGAVIEQIDLVGLFVGLFGAEKPSYAESAADKKPEYVDGKRDLWAPDYLDENGNLIWIANIPGIIRIVTDNVSRENDVVSLSVNVANVIGKVFAKGHGPSNLDQFVNGSEDAKIEGLFTTEDNTWLEETFAGSTWISTGDSIANLFKSTVSISISDDPEIAISVATQGNGKVSISLTASIEDSESEISYTATRPDAVGDYFDMENSVITNGTDVWAVLCIARQAEAQA